MRPTPRLRSRTVRLLGAAVLTLSLSLGSTGISSAVPSQQDLANARAHLSELEGKLSLLVEQYNQARIALEKAQTQLEAARARMAKAREEAEASRDALSKRAVQAYEGGPGSQIDVLLGSSDFGEFSDRLEFLDTVAQQDADLIARAERNRQEALWASKDLSKAVSQHAATLDTLQSRRAAVVSGISDQQAVISSLEKQIAAAEEAARAAAAEKARDAASQSSASTQAPAPSADSGGADESTSGGSGGSGDSGGSGGDSGSGGGASGGGGAPPPSSGAGAAVAAAYSAIGTPYVWGGASLSGMDCSGLTLWSWAHAGVYLPHSSAAQYSVLPHVSSSELQPGDLLFFYSPISHVAMYVGGNQMIHATHPGVPVQVDTIASYWWDVYVGAGRPG